MMDVQFRFFKGDKGVNNFGDTLSDIPPYLTEIKESEFLAIQGK